MVRAINVSPTPAPAPATPPLTPRYVTAAPTTAPTSTELPFAIDSTNGDLYVWRGTAWVPHDTVDVGGVVISGAGEPTAAPAAGQLPLYIDNASGDLYAWAGSAWTQHAVLDESDIRNWCVGDGVANDAAGFAAALLQRGGKEITIPAGVVVNTPSLVAYTGAARIVGGGEIKHTRAGALQLTQPLTALGAVSAFATVALPVGYAAATTSRVTLAVASPAVTRGRVVLLVSSDPLPEQAGAFLGELARVQEVAGADVTFSAPLEFTYSASPVAYLLSENSVVVDGPTFTNPNYLTENTGQAQPALQLINTVRSEISAKFVGQANASLQLSGCWAPEVSVSVHNARNNHTDASYGYGVVLSGATSFAQVYIIGTNCRHVVSGGANSTANPALKGVARHNTVSRSVAIDPLSSGFDTHEGMYHTRYIDCAVRKSMGNVDYLTETTVFDYSDRGAGTQFINCTSFGGGGVRLGGAGYARQGQVGKYTTRVAGHTADVAVFSAAIGLTVASAVNATVAGYHEVEITNSTFRRTVVTLQPGSPRVLLDGVALREQDGSFSCGANNNVTLRRVSRRRAAALPNILVGPGTTLTLDDYTADGTAHSNGALVYCTGGAGTATVKVGRVQTPNATAAEIVKTDGVTVLAGSLLGAPVRPVATGVSASRPLLGSFERGQTYLDTTLSASGTPITWTGSAWVNGVGAVV